MGRRRESPPARFEALAPDRFAIIVDDNNAQYPILIDPLSHYDTVTGDQADCQFGFSVAYGNFNGGQGDFVVGAPYYDSGQTDEGKIFVFYGTQTGFPTSADWTAESDQANAHLGYSVGAGDFDANGFDDVVAGVPHYDSSSLTDNGATFVWFGSSTGLGSNGTPSNVDWDDFGSESNTGYGWSVADAGNVNGDSYRDLIVTNSIPAGLSVQASKMLRSGRISTDLGLLPTTFDNLYRWDGKNFEVYTLLPSGKWVPSEPVIKTMEAFMINASGPIEWTGTFQP